MNKIRETVDTGDVTHYPNIHQNGDAILSHEEALI